MAKKADKICDAVRNGDLEKLSKRLRKYDKSNLWRQDKAGNYSLHCAITTHMCTEFTKIEMLQYLLNSVPDSKRYQYISLKNTLASQTALHVAATHGSVDVVCTLMDSLTPAEIHRLVESKDYCGRTILDYELKNDIRDIILGYTESLDTNNDKVSILDERLAAVVNIDQTDGKPSAKCSENSSKEISCDSDVEAEHPTETMLSMFSRRNRLRASSSSYSGIQTRLPDGVREEQEEEDEDTVFITLPEEIGEEGAPWRLMPADDNTFAEIHKAVVSKNLKHVRNVLSGIRSQEEKSELLSRVDSMGKTLLHHAVSHNSLDILQELVNNIGPTYRSLLDRKDTEEKTVKDYATAKQIREFLRSICLHYWEPIVRPPDIIIISNGVEDNTQSEQLRTYACEMKSRGMKASLYTDIEEDKAIEVIMKCQIDNTTGIILLAIETGSTGELWNIDNILGALHTTAMYYRPKVVILQRAAAFPPINIWMKNKSNDDSLIVLSNFRRRQLPESLVMSFCAALSRQEELVSLDRVLSEASRYAEKRVIFDTLNYALQIGPKKLTIVDKVKSCMFSTKGDG